METKQSPLIGAIWGSGAWAAEGQGAGRGTELGMRGRAYPALGRDNCSQPLEAGPWLPWSGHHECLSSLSQPRLLGNSVHSEFLPGAGLELNQHSSPVAGMHLSCQCVRQSRCLQADPERTERPHPTGHPLPRALGGHRDQRLWDGGGAGTGRGEGENRMTAQVRT